MNLFASLFRTPEDSRQAGVNYVRNEIAEGVDPQRLWHECDPSFDNHPFDAGMADELTKRGIPHPLDPLA